MDPTLKRRLVGAAVLIVLAAIVLPMFLAGPPPEQRRTESLPLEIPPPPDRELSRVEMPLAGDVADPDRVVTVDTAAEAAPPAAPAGNAAGAGTGPGTAGPASTPPPAAPVAEPPPAPAAAAAAQSPAPAAPAADAPAAPASPGVLPASAAGGRFWVNLGSYGQSANADRVEAAARRAGATVRREQVQSGARSLERLRAGPWATRAQAEQARQRLIAALPDAQPRIEEDGDAGAPAAAPATAAGAGAFAVQVGAFAQEATARQLGDRLRSAGYPAFVVRRGDSHAVRVGPYTRREQAQAQLDRLKSSQRLDGLVVAHP